MHAKKKDAPNETHKNKQKQNKNIEFEIHFNAQAKTISHDPEFRNESLHRAKIFWVKVNCIKYH